MLASLAHMNAIYKQQSRQTKKTVKIPSSPSSLASSQGNPRYLVYSISISHDMALWNVELGELKRKPKAMAAPACLTSKHRQDLILSLPND